MEQIRHKLIAFEDKAKATRVKAVMKWWTKCISMVIAKIQWFAEEFLEIRKEDWYTEKKEYFEKVSDATYREDWRHPDPELRDL